MYYLLYLSSLFNSFLGVCWIEDSNLPLNHLMLLPLTCMHDQTTICLTCSDFINPVNDIPNAILCL